MRKYLITGSNGLVGSSLKKILGDGHVYHTKDEVDLTDSKKTLDYITYHVKNNGVNSIINCSAKVGGVQANMKNNKGFFIENFMINNNVIESSFKNEIPNFVNLLSTCIFPDKNITFSNLYITRLPDYYTVNTTPYGEFTQLVTNEFDYNGELEGTNLVVTDGDLNGDNTFLNYPKTPTNYAPVLYNSSTVTSGDFLLNTTIPGSGQIYLFYDTGSILSPFDNSSNL
jgi:hypothetical protein